MKKEIIFCVFLGWFVAFGIQAQSDEKQPTSYEDILIPDQVIVQMYPGVSGEEIVRLMPQNIGFQIVELLSPTMNIWLFSFDDTVTNVNSVLNQVHELPQVNLAQENTWVYFREVPNDPLYSNQWQHPKIQLPEAWDITTGGTTANGHDIVVCIIESANVMGHADLSPNHWKNEEEIPNNGIDDDGNGYIDDYNGWNVASNNDQIGTGAHGTQVAGMIGAKGNNELGVVGANWDVKMMVVAGYNQPFNQAQIVKAYEYPLKMRQMWNDSNGAEGAFVVATNASWGIDNGNPDDYPIWCGVYDTLGQEGILNCGATTNNNANVDVFGDMPTTCPSEFMVSVTATNSNDTSFTGYGLTHVDVAAPGSNIYTTSGSGSYGSTSGTSFASPYTAGLIGLMYSIPCQSFMDLVMTDPQAAAEAVRDAVFNGVDVTAHLEGRVKYGGRINAKSTIDLLMESVCVLANTDVGVKNFIAPVSGELTNAEAITITVRNYGANTQSNIPVYYNIDGGANVTEVFTGTLASMEEATYTFTTLADLSTPQHTYTLVAGTNLVGDEVVSNNEKSVEVTNTTLSFNDIPLDNTEFVVVTLENNLFDVLFTTYEPIDENIYLKVYNTLGQIVAQHLLEASSDGSYQYKLNMNYHASGVYYVRVGTSSHGSTKKIIVQ